MVDTTLCPCGLDPAPILRVVSSAGNLANAAAAEGAKGNWQAAFDLASESLALRSSSNDLAAFVTLAAAFAGARGRLAVRSAIQIEELNPALQLHARSLIDLVNQIKSLDQSSGGQPAEVAVDLLNRLPALPFLDRVSSGRSELPSGSWRRFPAPLAIALVAAAVLLSGAIITWSLVSSRRGAVLIEKTELSSPPSPDADRMESSADSPVLDQERTTLEEQKSRADLSNRVLLAFLRRDWSELARAVESIDPMTQHRLASEVPQELLRRAYLAGIEMSRAGEHEGAAALLGLVMRGIDGTEYFADDALYYRARNLHRSDRYAEARAAYELLLTQHARSPYRTDAQRFLDTLNGSGYTQGQR